MANYEVVVKPAVKGWGNTLASQISKQGLNFVDDAGKGFKSFDAFKRAYGGAGKGNAWHHIVEQNADNVSKFGAEAIHNTDNLMKLPHGAGTIHNKISAYYSSKDIFTNGQTVRQWLKSQSYEQQYEFGINTLKRFGWIPR